MATLFDKMRAILAQSEKGLRDVIIDAAQSGDYEGLDVARNAAGRIHDLLQAVPDNWVDQNGGEPSKEAGTPMAPSSVTPRRRSNASGYPRFYVRDDQLYKIGWSRTEKAEYVHKMPKEVFDSIVAVIEQLRASGARLIKFEEISAGLEAGNSPVPAYQIYLTLAVLRANGLADKRGHDGYSVAEQLLRESKRVWRNLVA